MYYQWQYVNWFEFLFHNLECVTFILLIMRLVVFLVASSEIICVLCPRKLKDLLKVYTDISQHYLDPL